MVDPVRPTAHKSDKSVPTLVTELWELVLAYLKQETLEPLKGLGRFVGFGIVGAAFMAIGFVLMSIALLRVFQIETGTHLTGNWSWAPYALTLLVVIAVAGFAASRIATPKRKKGGRS